MSDHVRNGNNAVMALTAFYSDALGEERGRGDQLAAQNAQLIEQIRKMNVELSETRAKLAHAEAAAAMTIEVEPAA